MDIDTKSQQTLTSVYDKCLSARAGMIQRLVQLGKGQYRSEVIIDVVIRGVLEYLQRVAADPTRYNDQLSDVPRGPNQFDGYANTLVDDVTLLFQQISFGAAP